MLQITKVYKRVLMRSLLNDFLSGVLSQSRMQGVVDILKTWKMSRGSAMARWISPLEVPWTVLVVRVSSLTIASLGTRSKTTEENRVACEPAESVETSVAACVYVKHNIDISYHVVTLTAMSEVIVA